MGGCLDAYPRYPTYTKKFRTSYGETLSEFFRKLLEVVG
jgi:hypothetical protein